MVRKPVLITDYSPLRAATQFRLKPEPNPNQTVSSNIAIDPDSVKLVALVEEINVSDSASLFSQAQPRAAQTADCEVMAVNAPDSRGAVLLTVVSDCRADMAFSVNHGGMTFTAETDERGMSLLTVPAMTTEATFFITFEDGKSLATSTYVPNAERYNRVVFQWEGHVGTYLEETADMNDFAMLDRLGTDVGEIPRFAEVFSFPVNTSLTDGMAGIDLLARVTENNCEQDLVAESFTIFRGLDDLQFKDIRITLPDCDQVGDTIALKKVLGEQTLAAK